VTQEQISQTILPFRRITDNCRKIVVTMEASVSSKVEEDIERTSLFELLTDTDYIKI
jgi:hypothetical protein